jgi:hypothetical protein
MADDYTYYTQAVAGQKPPMYVDHPQAGFYRKPVKKRDANGNAKRVGWDAVNIFTHEGALVAVIGQNEITITDRDRINEIWSHVAGNPVGAMEWAEVMEQGLPWREFRGVPASDRDVTAGDNGEPEVDPIEEYATKIKNAADASPKTVTNAEEAATAAGSMNRIAELRLDCDKAGKASYQPLHVIYSAEQKRCSEPVKLATNEEARLKRLILNFQESERKRLAKEAEEATAKQDIAADPVPVAAPAPIKANYGARTVKAEPKLWAIINDPIAALAHFKDDAEIIARVKKLATDAVRAGKAVPGVSSVEAIVEPST